MIAPALCLVAFLASYLAGRRSLGLGLCSLFATGYFYGILRANLITTASHFIFDASLLGLYVSQRWSSQDPQEAKRLGALRLWLIALIGWPLMLVFMPFQPLLVSLVGLRGNIFFIPVFLLGSRLKNVDLVRLSGGLALLNLVALGFAIAEYLIGVPAFYPLGPATQIIYASGDVAGGFFRIPAIFTSAHAYGGTMVGSLPLLLGLWALGETTRLRVLALLGVGAALVGVLMSATRQHFVLAAAMILATVFTSRGQGNRRVAVLLLVAALGWLALSHERLQRFKSLSDTDAVVDRVAGSVNRGFWEILIEYPMGNGLGGGGSSMPYFLQGQVRNPIGMENEYARILSEQGVIGLMLWLGFVAWFFSRGPIAFAKGEWSNSRRLAWCLAAVGFGTAWIGTGLLTSIPGTVNLLLSAGWASTAAAAEGLKKRQWQVSQAASRLEYGIAPGRSW